MKTRKNIYLVNIVLFMCCLLVIGSTLFIRELVKTINTRIPPLVTSETNPVISQPTSTPFPTSIIQTTANIPPTFTQIKKYTGTGTEFKTYLRDKYSVISGQKLDIHNIDIFDIVGYHWLRSIDINLTSDSALYVFAEQTPQSTLSYGTNLLMDTISYFGGEDCTAYVSYNFHSNDIGDYVNNEWYYIGYCDLDSCLIEKYYVMAHFQSGEGEIRVWNNDN